MRSGAAARPQRVAPADPWRSLDAQLSEIDTNLRVDKSQRRIFCPPCPAFTLQLPAVLEDGCADALARCRVHASSAAHVAGARGKRQRTLMEFGVVAAQAPNKQRCAHK
jgi:hypothetical protein